MNNTMNIYALKGHQVTVTTVTMNNGYECDKEQVKELLGKELIVDHTEVGGSLTNVYLQGHEGSFNSVNFVDLHKQSHEDDVKHHDWHRYNR